MKRIFLLTFLLGFSVWGFGQTIVKSQQNVVGKTPKAMKSMQSKTFDRGFEKNTTCVDTLYYPMMKEVYLGTPTYYNYNFGSGTSVSQTYLNSASISVTGFVFYADTSGTASVNLTVSLYNAGANFLPTTQIAGTSSTVTVTGFDEYNVTFPTPVTVTGNFAVVIANESGSSFKMISNAAGDYGEGEGLASVYDGSVWSSLLAATTYDDDMLAHPVVSYNITTSFTASDYDVCPGTPITLTGAYTPASTMTNRMFNFNEFSVYYSLSGDTLYAWDYDDGSADFQINPTTHTYTTSGTYNAAFVLWGGFYENCIDYYEAPITVFDNPTVTATANPTAICPGGTSTLTAGGASTYEWSTTSTSNPITVTPSGTTTYSVTGTDANTCTNSATVTVTQNAAPTIGINASATTICEGTSTTLTGTGGVLYGWSTGATTNSITVSPTMTTTYTVGAQDINGCTGTAEITINVNPKPTIGATATPASVCPGVQSSLSATGGVSYNWNPGNLSGTPVNVTPTGTTIYTVTGTDGNNCTNTATVTVTVYDAPVVTLVAADSPICEGTSTTLTASGANTYAWSHSLPAGVSNSVSPISTTTYSVTGTDINNCTAVASATVNVNPKPTITALATPSTLCTGQSTTLTAGGGVSYLWDNGLGIGNNFVQTPLTTTTYNVTGTDALTCTNTASVTVNVAPCTQPTASITASDNDICIGQSITYTDNSSGVNVDTWAWTFAGGSIAAAGTQGPHTVTYNTAGNHTVTLQVTDDNGTDDTTITIVVHDLPNVTVSASVNPVCAGSPTNLTAAGAATYVWNGGSAANPYTVSPTAMTAYSVTGTDVNGCQNSAIFTVNVNTLPNITLSASANNFCAGNPTTLTAGGGTSYVWDQSLSGTVNTVNPTTNTTYSITGTDGNNCQNTASVNINVLPVPTVSASASPASVCPGGSSVLTASGNAIGYVWDGSATNPITVNPTTTTTYTVTGANASACTATASVTVTVLTAPTITATATPAAVCEGGSSVLTAGGGATYMWTGSVSTNPYTVTPASTTTYSVTGTDGSGCSAVASVAVTVNPLPTVSVVFPAEVATVCQDSLVALSGGSPAGGVWSGTGVTGSDFLANTTGAFTITYTYTDANTCSNSATGTITVENCTSISEFSNNTMLVYPNPSSDAITISFDNVDASRIEISLFDLSGRLVSNEVLNLNGLSVKVPVNQLPAGIYTLKVKAGTDVFFTKITRL